MSLLRIKTKPYFPPTNPECSTVRAQETFYRGKLLGSLITMAFIGPRTLVNRYLVDRLPDKPASLEINKIILVRKKENEGKQLFIEPMAVLYAL